MSNDAVTYSTVALGDRELEIVNLLRFQFDQMQPDMRARILIYTAMRYGIAMEVDVEQGMLRV